MRRGRIAAGVAALAAFVALGFGASIAVSGQAATPTVATQTFTNVVTYTIPTVTETTTETVTVSETEPPTTTEPLPPPTPASLKTGIKCEWWFASDHNPEGLTRLGAKLVRLEVGSGTTASSFNLSKDMGILDGLGIKVTLMAGFHAARPSASTAGNVKAWIDKWGPNGTDTINAIEFGNETYGRWQYPSESVGTTARWYATELRKVALAIESTGVPLLAQVSDQSESQTNEWVDGMFAAVPDLLQHVDGWTFHPYGPPDDARTRIGWAVSALARHGDTTRPFYFTEFGIATDNGRTLNDNYSWPRNLTYQQAADGLTASYAMWNQTLGVRLREVYIYTQWDGATPGSSTEREYYFGAFQRDTSTPSGQGGFREKGAWTAAIRSRLSG